MNGRRLFAEEAIRTITTMIIQTSLRVSNAVFLCFAGLARLSGKRKAGKANQIYASTF